MTRPTYEQEHDRENEQSVSALVKRRFGADHVKKLPMSYGMDFALVKGGDAQGYGGRVMAFAEVKDRSGRNGNRGLEYGADGGYYIAVQKVIRAQALFMATNAHAHLIVRLVGDVVMQTPLDVIVYGATIPTLWHGREDRGDPADLEPELAIPWESFERLSKP